MNRRSFLLSGATAAAGVWVGLETLGSQPFSPAFAAPGPLAQKVAASDVVTLGKTGIRTSRLAMGTGTVGSGHHSNQTALGLKGLSDLLLNGYDHGLRFFDSADAYGSHPHVAEALKHVARDKVTVLTKTWARDPKTARADLERFRSELGTDTIDICLMHCLTEGDWTERYKGSPWVEVDLARINPIGSHMDASPQEVVSVLKEMKATGKGIIGMKILGQGDLRGRVDDALRYALSLGVLDAFTIGAESRSEQEDLIRRVAAA